MAIFIASKNKILKENAVKILMQEKKIWYINFTVDLNILDENKNALENLRREELLHRLLVFVLFG